MEVNSTSVLKPMTGDYQTAERMALKLAAIPLPDFKGKRVLDVGCDHGAFSFLASERGAVDVLGLDRNRRVRGVDTDLVALNRAAATNTNCRFEMIDIGRQWKVFGRFDVILVCSVYHHLFNNCGDHRPIWFWLWQHCAAAAEVIWEGPVDDTDPVVRANVSDDLRPRYTLEAILEAASWYFAAEHIGPALHEPTRQVWRFRPHRPEWRARRGMIVAGAGGAARAFEYDEGRRCREIAGILGWRPYPGSLNLTLDGPFGWEDGFYRARVLDVVNRAKGFESEWTPRWARFYPVMIDGEDACAMRFEGENYSETFMELLAPDRLRDLVAGPTVTITR